MQPRSSAAAIPEAHETSAQLAAILSLLRPRTVLSKHVLGAGKFSVRYGRYEDPAFGLVLEGSCFLDVDGAGVFALAQGDFVLLPETPAFTMSSELGLKPTLVTPASQGSEVRYGAPSGPAALRMLGGWFQFDRANAGLLVKLLPRVVHIRREAAGAARLRRVAELIGDETVRDHPGRDLILERLADVLLVEALRFRPVPAKREQGLLAGLSDPALARPLRGIHVDVARRWTVAELARAAGMSRAVFAERFARKVGMPPMQYLLEWRMAVARDLLRRERPPLAEVAERVGYQSASAFSTAFARFTGVSPSEFARSAD
jgi:AraC-like DNA-binding protein